MQRQHTQLLLNLVLFTLFACNSPPPPPKPATSSATSSSTASPAQTTAQTTTQTTPSTSTTTNTTPATSAAPTPSAPTFQAHTPEQQALLDKGTQALDKGDLTTATLAFEALQRTQPLSGLRASGALALADLYLQKNRPKDAIRILNALRKEAPPTAEVSFVLGQAYKATGEAKPALAAFQEAVSIDPMLLHANIEVGGLLHELGRAEESKEVFLNYERAIYKNAKLLEDEKTPPAQKFRIIEAFSFIPDDRIAQSLVDALDDPTHLIRIAAAEALGELGIQNTIPELERVQKQAKTDGDTLMVRMAQQSIDRIRANPSETSEDRKGQEGVGPTFVDPKANTEPKTDPKSPTTPSTSSPPTSPSQPSTSPPEPSR